MKMGKILYTLVILILVGVFCYSAHYVGSYYLEGQAQQAHYDDLADIVESIRNDPNYTPPTGDYVAIPGGDGAGESGEAAAPRPMLPEYVPLFEMNPHIVGWITIPETKVNYPVMQTPDSVDYYLYRNFDGKKSSRGCLYARESCDINAPSDNITIYGHNMKDGSMFGNLERYRRESYWQTHRYIAFDTLYEHHTYEIFAVFRTSASVGEGFPYHKFADAADEAEFNEFVAQCKALSLYDTGITPVYGDKMICLSTCEYTQTNGRFVVVAVRVT